MDPISKHLLVNWYCILSFSPGVMTKRGSWEESFKMRSSDLRYLHVCYLPRLQDKKSNKTLKFLKNQVSFSDCTDYILTVARWQWHPTPVLLPGKSHGWRSLVDYKSMGLLSVRHDWATSLSLFTFMHWRRKWQPTPVFLPGESQGRGSLVGLCLWGHTESDTTEVT